ncbi:MAG: SDR family NAD(P)-dependent oxidoreductase [Pseudomonadota bacterium]
MINRTAFGPKTTADEVLDGIDMTGQRVLITGGTSGLGAETARAMAARGADVTITARSARKAADVVADIKTQTGKTVAVEELELGSMASIRAFAERVNAGGEKIDVLINNAGIMACPQGQTEDGFETQFGTNHLGHFLMTALVAQSLKDGGRVVALSSSAHQMSDVLFDDIDFAKSGYNQWVSYGQSKTANALFAIGLNKRLAARGIEVFSVHPGAIQTGLGRHLSFVDILKFLPRILFGGIAMKSVQAGAATQCYAATAPEIKGQGGRFLANCGIAPISQERVRKDSVVWPYAQNADAAERLWTISEEMVGHQFA